MLLFVLYECRGIFAKRKAFHSSPEISPSFSRTTALGSHPFHSSYVSLLVTDPYLLGSPLLQKLILDFNLALLALNTKAIICMQFALGS